jgi:hypothetical protein
MTMLMECTSESLGAFLVSWSSSEGILPLWAGAASTKMYIERGAEWCGQGKNNSFFEGCGVSACLFGSRKTTKRNMVNTVLEMVIYGSGPPLVCGCVCCAAVCRVRQCVVCFVCGVKVHEENSMHEVTKRYLPFKFQGLVCNSSNGVQDCWCME